MRVLVLGDPEKHSKKWCIDMFRKKGAEIVYDNSEDVRGKKVDVIITDELVEG